MEVGRGLCDNPDGYGIFDLVGESRFERFWAGLSKLSEIMLVKYQHLVDRPDKRRANSLNMCWFVELLWSSRGDSGNGMGQSVSSA